MLNFSDRLFEGRSMDPKSEYWLESIFRLIIIWAGGGSGCWVSRPPELVDRPGSD